MPDAREGGGTDQQFAQWINSARSGDRNALQQIMNHIRGYLLLVANQELSPVLQKKAGPSDLVQETFVQLQQNIGQFRGASEAELLAWARRILLNGIQDVQRRYSADKRDVAREQPLTGDSRLGVMPAEPEANVPAPGTTAVDREMNEGLQIAIRQLPVEYQEVLRLRTWQKLSFAEVGERLGKSADAARMLWNRAVRRLQQEMESDDD
jgi:RNA polymerase sigma-70 factor (ECF subfamily)